MANVCFSLTSAAVDPRLLEAGLTDPKAGAFVAFEGRVRNHNEGSAVNSLEYEAFGPLAEKEGLRILTEAAGRFEVLGITCVHRTGHLHVGDVAVWVGVTAAHRGAAFEACRFVIDEVKDRVPIWKKEHYADGASGWINCATRGDFAKPGPA
jgi:molybdopterin synthase catalytic subunit